MMRRSLIVWALLAAAAPTLAQPAPPAIEVAVRQQRVLADRPGTLVVSPTTIEFRTADPKHSRRWPYAELKQIAVRDDDTIAVSTYEDGSRLKLGADRTFVFRTSAAIEPSLVQSLVAHAGRALVTAVLPPLPAEAQFAAPARHEQRNGSAMGALRLYPDALVFSSDRRGGSRYWRLSDIEAVLPLDRFRLQVTAREDGLHPYTFVLPEEIPAAFYETLWAAVNRPLPLRAPAADCGCGAHKAR